MPVRRERSGLLRARSVVERLRAVAFFAAAMFTQNFDNVMLPPKSHILGTPNRNG
jgi:hypothetical protein